MRRIKIISPSLQKVRCTFPALSSLWGAILYSVFRLSPPLTCGRVLLNSSHSCQKDWFLWGGGPPPSSASIAFQVAYQNLASPDSPGAGPPAPLGRHAYPPVEGNSPLWEIPLLGVGLEDQGCFHPNQSPASLETASFSFWL